MTRTYLKRKSVVRGYELKWITGKIKILNRWHETKRHGRITRQYDIEDHIVCPLLPVITNYCTVLVTNSNCVNVT